MAGDRKPRDGRGTAGAPRGVTRRADVDAVLAACRLLVAVSVRSLAAVEDIVSVQELRILTVIASRPAASLGLVAQATGLHISRASRTCDRLVNQGLLDREPDPDDRRTLRLTLSSDGRAVVTKVASARRAAVRPALDRLSSTQRTELITALQMLTDASRVPDEHDLWALGWTT